MIKKGIYKHFKGNLYEVLFIAKNSETEEDMVVYKSLRNGTMWVRPLSMWEELVERGGKTYQRFTYVGGNVEEKDNNSVNTINA